jgi:hypothetical protein
MFAKYVGQDEILRAVVNRAIKPPAGLDKRVTNPLKVVNLPHGSLYSAKVKRICLPSCEK